MKQQIRNHTMYAVFILCDGEKKIMTNKKKTNMKIVYSPLKHIDQINEVSLFSTTDLILGGQFWSNPVNLVQFENSDSLFR